ncbi:5'-nucleotidase [Micrococcus luteus]|nr:5'-nucleotidase [Micrococcus luteus]MCV7635471.1 5'-nucleotidase [Micrococcus luteus]
MGYSLKDKLVVGVASSALFDLTESDNVFQNEGEIEYRKYQEEKVDEILNPGVAFPFVRRLLSLNDLSEEEGSPLVEVIILSRNDPETGLRVMRSVEKHNLPISRAIFRQGRSPFDYMKPLNMSLFLSANGEDVRSAVRKGLPGGQVLGTPAKDPAGTDLRVAFDFDGVLADDSSEQIMQSEGLPAFHDHERSHADIPMAEGMLSNLLRGLNRIQDTEDRAERENPGYHRRLNISIVTARNAPSHERVVRTLQDWGVRVNDAFFLGGISKDLILRTLQPHIFFDDQVKHLESSADFVASVHIPFGVINSQSPNEADHVN